MCVCQRRAGWGRRQVILALIWTQNFLPSGFNYWQQYNKAEFLKLSTIGILGLIILCMGTIHSIVGHLAASLASTTGGCSMFTVVSKTSLDIAQCPQRGREIKLTIFRIQYCKEFFVLIFHLYLANTQNHLEEIIY